MQGLTLRQTTEFPASLKTTYTYSHGLWWYYDMASSWFVTDDLAKPPVSVFRSENKSKDDMLWTVWKTYLCIANGDRFSGTEILILKLVEGKLEPIYRQFAPMDGSWIRGLVLTDDTVTVIHHGVAETLFWTDRTCDGMTQVRKIHDLWSYV